MPLLEANNLAKSYRKKCVIRDVSLSVETAQIVGLLGPNGAGKTTCFYMMVGLIKADKGSLLINGQDVTRKPMHYRAKKGLGYLPQEASIFRKLSVEDNILSVLQTRSKLTKKEQKDKTNQLLEEFNILHIRKSLGISLSGGERRRVEIARSLALEPQVILLDEPFAGVDPISVSDIKKIIYQVQQRGIAVLITDHNVRETLDICEKAYIVANGLILAEGSPKTVLNNQTVRDVYLGEQFQL